MTKYIIPAIDYLANNFMNSCQMYNTDMANLWIILFACYYVFAILIFWFVWRPYLKSLNNKIWRTKGMLSMIPTDIMKKYENLRNAFNSNDIMEAVR